MPHDSPPVISYKTVKLAKGKHSSPEEGACVMELASMLAGEPFGDHPQAVCPVIGAFLRVYNDSLDDQRRQDLYDCAAQVVGTRATPEVERQRIERCRTWAGEMWRSRSWLARVLTHTRMTARRLSSAEVAAVAAVNAIGRHTATTHAAAVALVDELCTIGRQETRSGNVVPLSSERRARARQIMPPERVGSEQSSVRSAISCMGSRRNGVNGSAPESSATTRVTDR